MDYTKLGSRSKHPLYKTWINIDGSHQTEWKDFPDFVASVVSRPSGCVLSRIEASRPFGPNNFIWKPANQRSGKTLTYKGETRTISGWSKVLGISRETIKIRLKRGWSVEETLSRKPINKKSINKYVLRAKGMVKGHQIDNKVIYQCGSLKSVMNYFYECMKACLRNNASCQFFVTHHTKTETKVIAEISV